MKKPWYKEGLSFKCTGCGKCCTGFPGHVWVTLEEIDKMAKLLGLSSQEFMIRYVRKVGSRLSLKELPKTYDCVFLKGKACTVYEERPSQCRTYPWWKENLENEDSWQEAAKLCEGINHPEAEIVPFPIIQQALDIDE